MEVGTLSHNGSQRHPLQGQADYLLNGALGYSSASGTAEATVLLSAVGKRLQALGYSPLPDIYAQPFASLDATAGFAPFHGARV